MAATEKIGGEPGRGFSDPNRNLSKVGEKVL